MSFETYMFFKFPRPKRMGGRKKLVEIYVFFIFFFQPNLVLTAKFSLPFPRICIPFVFN
jgi:hypothetical protein